MENEDEVFDACNRAVESIPLGASVYLDVTGGFRDSAMLLTSVMQMIKGRDLSLEGVFYVNFFSGSSPENPCQILDRTGAYSAFDLVSGLNELLKTGSVATLKEYFFSKNLHPLEQAILDRLAEVSQEIRLCRIGQSLVALSHLREALAEYETAEFKQNKLFAHVVEKGRQKYALLMDKEDATFADFVEWSVKNKDYSQALSYYYEKIPAYFVETRLIYPGEQQRKVLIEGEPSRPLLGNERSWQQRFLAPRNPKAGTDKYAEIHQKSVSHHHVRKLSVQSVDYFAESPVCGFQVFYYFFRPWLSVRRYAHTDQVSDRFISSRLLADDIVDRRHSVEIEEFRVSRIFLHYLRRRHDPDHIRHDSRHFQEAAYRHALVALLHVELMQIFIDFDRAVKALAQLRLIEITPFCRKFCISFEQR
jgi:hypothetical protein